MTECCRTPLDFPGENTTIANSSDYPAEPLEGNDDPGFTDEDNNPYSDNQVTPPTDKKAAIGQVASTDRPNSPFVRLQAGQGNETVEVRVQFQEFVRLQIGDSNEANSRNWYVISDPYPWQNVIRYKRGANGMNDNGSTQSTDNDGW